MSDNQQHNLSELIVALQALKTEKGDFILSHDLLTLLKEGLHHSLLPHTLQPKAAEAMQLTYEAIGGLPREVLWADKNYGAFMKLYARQTSATIGPVVPPPRDTPSQQEWPEWLTLRRLAYQEVPMEGASAPNEDTD